jgi:cellulose synthase/poly-beta-1,6-N-acetylglucosamine synthase-like glycosyltransferase
MTSLSLFLMALSYLAAFYLLFNCGYILYFTLAGHLARPSRLPEAQLMRRICVLIPAYQEDQVILETGLAAFNHHYRGGFDVFVVADGLKPQTLATLKGMGVGTIEVAFEKSTKGKALQKALDILPENAYDIALVLDADNIMAGGFLEKVNNAFEAGHTVVQGHRTAKNLDTPFALLDACNEEINNQIFRKGHQAAGFSAALIGSGMAFHYGYLRQLLVGIGEVAGEDKELDFRIVKDKNHIYYLHDALVYDEKVAQAQVFAGQRSRWIAAQIDCARKYFIPGFRALFGQGNTTFFDKVLQTLLLPRILLMGTLSLLFALAFLNPYGLPPAFWGALLLTAGITLLLALPGRFYNTGLLKAVVRLPLALFFMCLALLKVRQAGKSFVHTPHGQPHLDIRKKTEDHMCISTTPYFNNKKV